MKTKDETIWSFFELYTHEYDYCSASELLEAYLNLNGYKIVPVEETIEALTGPFGSTKH